MLRDGRGCWLCGRLLTLETATIDHVIPKSDGGGNDDDNLRCACWRCNHRKADWPIEWLLFHVRGRHVLLRKERANVIRRMMAGGENIVALGDDHLRPRKRRRRRSDGSVMPYR